MNETAANILSVVEHKGKCSPEELLAQLNRSSIVLTKTALYWYLNKLIKENLLTRESRGVYVLSQKPVFHPSITPRMKEISSLLKKELPFADFCLYEGAELAAYQHNVSTNSILYVETQRDTCEAAFNILEREKIIAFVRPTSDIIYHYVNLADSPVFIKNLTSESPVQVIDGVTVPKLEKLLVDIRTDEDFSYLNGTESFYVLRNAVEMNAINKSTLLRYARRRNVEEKVRKDLEELGL